MSSSNIFTQLLEGQTFTKTETIRKTKAWFESEYRITKVKDPNFFTALTDVHDHDNQPLHFGNLRIGSSFQSMRIELLKLRDGWHIGVVIGNSEPTIIHPLSEGNNDPKGRSALMAVRQILKSGSIMNEQVQPQYTVPDIPALAGLSATSGIPSSQDFGSKIPGSIIQQLNNMDKVDDDAGEPPLAPEGLSEKLLTDSWNDNASLTIDMDQFLPETPTEEPVDSPSSEDDESEDTPKVKKKKRRWGR